MVSFFFLISQLGYSTGEKIELSRRWRTIEPTWKSVNLLDCDQTPVIGRYTAINDGHVTIYYWKGTYQSILEPDHFRGNQRKVA